MGARRTSVPHAVLYVRIDPAVRVAVEGYADARDITLAQAVEDLLRAGCADAASKEADTR